jgi:hypothetical protein
MRGTAKLLVPVLLGAGAVWFFQQRAPIHHAPGVLVPDEPEQITLVTTEPPALKNGWTLQPLARYAIRARVLSRRYYDDDSTAALSPCDLALGWGRMSDEAVLERLAISQDARCYRWQYWGGAPIPEKEIITHSANVHVIPADPAVAAKIAALRVGSLVQLNGSLVEATHPQADRPWRSSLTREDEGEGACEILWVESLKAIDL